MATVETVLSSLFSTIPELHAGQLGLLSGLLVGILYWHRYRRSSMGLLAGFYLLAIGIVPPATKGLFVMQLNPWYFCSLLVATSLVSIGARVALDRATFSRRSRSTAVTQQDLGSD